MMNAPALPARVGVSASRTHAHRYLPLLTLLFAGSGCAALIYEIIWLQLLSLVIGASAISLGVLLGTFMGGMCLGSLLLSRVVSRKRHPLRVYAALEGLIGICGLAVLFFVPILADLYTHFASPGGASVAWRALISGICLVPPTLLMGATLPAIARWVQATPRGVSWLGFFYGGNIAGAVFGCFFAGFYLLRVHDMNVATFWAFGINVGVAGLAFLLSLAAPRHPAGEADAAISAAHDMDDAPVALPEEQGPAGVVYLVIGLSGLTALGAEVVWTRLLSLMLGATVYTFSIILGVFLLGLGIGSAIGAGIARNTRRPRTALAVCQILLAAAMAWAAYAIGKSLPFWPVDPELSSSPWLLYQLDIARALWAVLPGAILWGASFPLALAAMAPERQERGGVAATDTGKLVGRVYAANTIGAIIGSLAFSMAVVPLLGSQGAEKLLIILAALSAVAAALPLLGLAGIASPRGGFATAGAGIAIGCFAAVFFAWTVPPVPWTAVAFGRYSATWLSDSFPPIVNAAERDALLYDARAIGIPVRLDRDSAGDESVVFMHKTAKTTFRRPVPEDERWLAANQQPLASALRKKQALGLPPNSQSYTDEIPDRYCTYVGEGTNVTVAVTYAPDDESSNPLATYRYFHGAGKVQASSDPPDMRLQRSLGHLAALAQGDPKDVLVVACGAGVTAGSFVPYDSVKRIVICDIEPMVPAHVAPMFAKENYNVVSDPRTQVIADDGRHFVRTTKEKFDIITSDPIDPWVKGCAALNTIEYYQMCKEHLKPGGVMALWIPLYENSSESAKSCIATFFKVFPNGILFSNETSDGKGYDAVLFGTLEPKKIDIDAIQKFLDAHPRVNQSLTDVGYGTGGRIADPAYAGHAVALDLLSSFAGDATDLQGWTADAQLNQDKNLRLQYLAGMAFNKQIAPQILQEILSYYRQPDDIFTGSPETLAAFHSLLLAKNRIQLDNAPRRVTLAP